MYISKRSRLFHNFILSNFVLRCTVKCLLYLFKYNALFEFKVEEATQSVTQSENSSKTSRFLGGGGSSMGGASSGTGSQASGDESD